MAYEAKILADSITANDCRLTTMQVSYPLVVHAEHLRHRMFSFSVASARAIPTAKIAAKVQKDPSLPVFWGANQPGMSADNEVSTEAKEEALALILKHRDSALELAGALASLGLHKQTVNRYLAPFQYVTVIVSGTEWDNFFSLRCHSSAQPEIQKVAEMMKVLYDTNAPTQLAAGSWHIPMASDKAELLSAGYELKDILRIASARIARISYETHNGKRDPSADLILAQSLQESRHWSPFEQIAQAQHNTGFHRNFNGWRALRAMLDGEDQ